MEESWAVASSLQYPWKKVGMPTVCTWVRSEGRIVAQVFLRRCMSLVRKGYLRKQHMLGTSIPWPPHNSCAPSISRPCGVFVVVNHTDPCLYFLSVNKSVMFNVQQVSEKELGTACRPWRHCLCARNPPQCHWQGRCWRWLLPFLLFSLLAPIADLPHPHCWNSVSLNLTVALSWHQNGT